ncbi:hypothetical protein EPH_0053080 [Eimeria praecox]|uniref:Transmembrane protein n=1 Tax=Eimeria praecox TaxID=51316 RepID=U6GTB2_9EIME|nr:hypothetical protein EPH_0053080 [Eimeria praecox]
MGGRDSAVVTFFELLHKDQPALSEESWSHLRLPIMLVTIVVAVGAQVYRSRKRGSRRAQASEEASIGTEMDDLWTERLQAERRALQLGLPVFEITEMDDLWTERLQAERRALQLLKQQQQQSSFGEPGRCTDTEEEAASCESSARF